MEKMAPSVLPSLRVTAVANVLKLVSGPDEDREQTNSVPGRTDNEGSGIRRPADDNLDRRT
jgi:hypothetical protein